jgi:hypothetical protein
MELYVLSGRRKNGTIRPIWQEEKWNYKPSGRRKNGTIGPIYSCIIRSCSLQHINHYRLVITIVFIFLF